MKKYRFILFGQVKEFWAYNKAHFSSRWRKSYPQFKHLKFSDFKNLEIVK